MLFLPRLPVVDASTRVLPDLFDFHAEHNPDFPWGVYAASGTTISSISFSEVVRASHLAAHFLGRQESIAERNVVVMLLHCDTILYVAMIVGVTRAGMVVRGRLLDADMFTHRVIHSRFLSLHETRLKRSRTWSRRVPLGIS